MRLKSEIWVKAYLRRCAVNGAMGVILRHGDDDAGAIYIKIVRSDRTSALFVPAPAGLDGADFDRRWVAALKGKWLSDAEVDDVLAKEQRFDEDMWIVEIEDRDGRHFLADDLIV
jgi:hypothetical protein